MPKVKRINDQIGLSPDMPDEELFKLMCQDPYYKRKILETKDGTVIAALIIEAREEIEMLLMDTERSQMDIWEES